MAEADDFYLWLDEGIKRGWVSEIACATHAGLPSTDEEDAQFDAGDDPCQFALRVWDF